MLLDTILRAARRELAGREIVWRAAVLAAAAAAVLPFAGPLLLGPRARRRLRGRPDERSVRGDRLHVLPEELALRDLRGPAASGRRDGPAGQTALGRLLPLSPRHPGVGRARGARNAAGTPRRARRLGSRHALPGALAEAERLLRGAARRPLPDRGRGLPREGLSGRRRAPGRRSRPRAGSRSPFPWRRASRRRLAAVRVPGSDFFETLEWMRRELPHAVDAYDARLLSATPPPALAGAGSVLAPWSLGHRILYGAELPVVANNFGYGFLDSIRFFLAGSEEEALAIARGQARAMGARDGPRRPDERLCRVPRTPRLPSRDGAGTGPDPGLLFNASSRGSTTSTARGRRSEVSRSSRSRTSA